MIDEKNIIYNENEAPVISQLTQENINKIPNTKQNIIDYEDKTEDNIIGNNGRWNINEHIRFLGGCLQYGNNWKKVETYVKTRNSTQIRSHAQKYLKKIEKKYFSKGSSKNTNISHNDNVIDEIINNNYFSKTKENHNNTEEKKPENLKNNENNKESNNTNNICSFKNEEFFTVDNKIKLSEEQIKKLVEELPKPDFNLEIVEKIILRIFKLNKKYEDLPKPDIISKKAGQKSNIGNNKNNKNIFLCQKLKREINYEKKVKEMLNSNSQDDLHKLFKIFDEKDSVWYDILMKQINDN